MATFFTVVVVDEVAFPQAASTSPLKATARTTDIDLRMMNVSAFHLIPTWRRAALRKDKTCRHLISLPRSMRKCLERTDSVDDARERRCHRRYETLSPCSPLEKSRSFLLSEM